MTKAFQMFLWENSPSVATPLGESMLNKVNRAVDEIDSRVVNFDTTKANQADLLTTLADVTFDENTGVITFTKKNGSATKIDTKLEKLAVNFSYDSANQRLVITLDDGTIQYVDMKALITELEFVNSNTVLFSVTDGKVSASIVKGSITADMIEPNYLANVELYASQALTSANNASKSAQEAEASAIRAEEAAEKAESIIGGDFATNAKVDNIINGTTAVGNAQKWNGWQIFISRSAVNSAFTDNTTIEEIVKEMPTYSRLVTNVWAGNTTVYPQSNGFLQIDKLGLGGYVHATFKGFGNKKEWVGIAQDTANGTVAWSGWGLTSDGGNADTVDGYHAYELMKNMGSNPTDFTITQSARITSNADGKFPFNYGSYVAFSSAPQASSGKYVLHVYATNGKLYWQKTDSNNEIVSDNWTQAVVTADLAKYVPITKAYPIYTGDILDITENGTYCCDKSNCTNFPTQISSWAYITKFGFRDAGYKKFIAFRLNSKSVANMTDIYVACEYVKDSDGNMIWKSVTEDFLPLDGSVPMTGDLQIRNGIGFFGATKTDGSLCEVDMDAIYGTTRARLALKKYANGTNELLLCSNNGSGWNSYPVFHSGNSAKVVVSETPLTAEGSVRVW